MDVTVTRIGKKGVIVIPKRLREALGLEEGMSVILELKGDRLILRPYVPKRVRLKGRVSEIVRKAKEEEMRLEA